MKTIASAIREALLTSDCLDKVKATRKLVRDWRRGYLDLAFDVHMPDFPERPSKPVLLPPNKMPKRGKAGSLRNRVALWHSLAHIEFIAIDLALDIVGRFGDEMGQEFISDFLSVAADEAMHFALLSRKLATLGSFYGELPAHDGLWQAAFETRHDIAARLAIVPMVLEARGLDVTPRTIERIGAAGDKNGVMILERILADEIRHVGLGTKHFVSFANHKGEEPQLSWQNLVKRYFKGKVKAPFNVSARLEAGLSQDFYAAIAS